MGREQVVGEHFPVGRRQEGQVFAREEMQLGCETFQLAGGVDDDDV